MRIAVSRRRVPSQEMTSPFGIPLHSPHEHVGRSHDGGRGADGKYSVHVADAAARPILPVGSRRRAPMCGAAPIGSWSAHALRRSVPAITRRAGRPVTAALAERQAPPPSARELPVARPSSEASPCRAHPLVARGPSWRSARTVAFCERVCRRVPRWRLFPDSSGYAAPHARGAADRLVPAPLWSARQTYGARSPADHLRRTRPFRPCQVHAHLP